MNFYRNHKHNGDYMAGVDATAHNGGQDATAHMRVGKVLLRCLKYACGDRNQWRALGWKNRRHDTAPWGCRLRRLTIAVCDDAHVRPSQAMVMAYERALANELVRYQHLGIVQIEGPLWLDGARKCEPNMDAIIYLTFIGR